MAMDIPKLMRQHMTVNRRGLELNGVQKLKTRYCQINLIHDLRQAFEAVKGQRITHPEASILLCFWRHSKKSGFVTLGCNRIASECTMSRSTVFRALQSLIDKDLLLVKCQHDTGRLAKGDPQRERGMYVIHYAAMWKIVNEYRQERVLSERVHGIPAEGPPNTRRGSTAISGEGLHT